MFISETFLLKDCEYAKPLTNPNWRKGTQHALLIKNSPMMVLIYNKIYSKLCHIQNMTLYTISYYANEVNNRFDGIFQCRDDYIQKYGEDLLQFIYPFQCKYANFYVYAKKFLRNISYLNLIHYYANGKEYYEYIYFK